MTPAARAEALDELVRASEEAGLYELEEQDCEACPYGAGVVRGLLWALVFQGVAIFAGYALLALWRATH